MDVENQKVRKSGKNGGPFRLKFSFSWLSKGNKNYTIAKGKFGTYLRSNNIFLFKIKISSILFMTIGATKSRHLAAEV